jgi:tetratricopeptide (TPR) repeat protein
VTPGADADFASFALGAAQFVSSSLEKHADRTDFQLASFADGLENVRSAIDARKILGANVALASQFEQSPDLLRARLDLLATDRSRIIASREIRMPRSEPFAFVDRLAREAAAMAGLPAPARDARAVTGIRGEGTLRFYLQGMGRLLSGSTADDAKRAAADFELACRTESDAALPRARLAAAQLRVHSFTREPEWLSNAEVSARESIRLDSDHAEGYFALGNVLSSQKRSAEAVPEYARASELDPTNDSIRLALGKTYGRLHQPELERAVYDATLLRRPHDWRPHWWLGSWHYRNEHVDDAIREFEAMIRCAPLLADGYAYLGGLLTLRGEYDRAVSTLRQALALRPTEAAFDNLGTAYFNSGKLAAAADAYNQSLQFGFVNYQSWLNLGDAYYWQSGRREQAAAAYAQGIRLAREELLARSQPGRTYDATIPAVLAPVFARLGEPDSARSYLAIALSADSSNSTVQYCAALTQWELQDRDRAIGWLTRAVAGGYPTAWLKDSPMFQDWRPVAAFRALIGQTSPTAQPNAPTH